MKVVCTGISGSGWKEYLEAVEQYSGGVIKRESLGDEMLRVSQEYGLGHNETNILDASPRELKLIRLLASERVLHKIEICKPEHIVVGIHATFRWKGTLVEGFDASFLNAFKPDMIVNIVNDLDAVESRLENHPQWRGKLSQAEILDWRDEEMLVSKVLATYAKCPFYVISASEPPSVLAELITKPKRPKAYLSFSITHSSEGELREIEQARDRLRQYFTIFDPFAIKEIRLTKDAPSLEDAVKQRIHRQIVARDRQLIDQSDMVIVYYPRNVFSAGVVFEVIYAAETQKEVYVVFPHEPSPFLSEPADRIFKSLDEFLQWWDARSSENAGSPAQRPAI